MHISSARVLCRKKYISEYFSPILTKKKGLNLCQSESTYIILFPFDIKSKSTQNLFNIRNFSLLPPPFSSLDKCVGIIKQFIHEIVMLVVAMYALNPRAVI